jgi:hypothetical protein
MALSETVQFRAVVGSGGELRPPQGLVLPKGDVLVTVSPLAVGEGSGPITAAVKWDWLLELAREVEDLHPGLPTDLSENHDHYAHQY